MKDNADSDAGPYHSQNKRKQNFIRTRRYAHALLQERRLCLFILLKRSMY